LAVGLVTGGVGLGATPALAISGGAIGALVGGTVGGAVFDLSEGLGKLVDGALFARKADIRVIDRIADKYH
jgi:hypothetical protein